MVNSEKDFGDQVVDDVKKDQTEEAAPIPESLQSMSDEDIQKLQKKMVRKMDIVIMFVPPSLQPPTKARVV